MIKSLLLLSITLSLFSFFVSSIYAAETYTNPVIGTEDAPDPGVIFCPEDNLYYATTTTGGLPAFHLRSSPDLVTWTDIGYIFHSAPSWGGTDGYWAPEIHAVNGGYNMYFVARNKQTGTLSVGVATSNKCSGPFTDSGQPVVTDSTMGQIDPTYFMDNDGKHYVIWKTDGNAVALPTPIRIAELTPNGTALLPGQNWQTTQLITSDLPWEHGITEGPWIVYNQNAYYLFYSGSGYYDGSYAVGVARATNITGPYTKFGPPILKNSTDPVKFEGPGHCSVLQTKDKSNWVMVYHAWPGTQRQFRILLLDSIGWNNIVNNTVWPTVANGYPSTDPQPIP